MPTEPSLILNGPELGTYFDSFHGPGAAPGSLGPWVRVKPNTVYRIQVAAFNADRQAGPRSEILTVDTTPHDPPGLVDSLVDPDPPNDFRLVSMPDYKAPAPALVVSWKPSRLATAYELYANTQTSGTATMDPSRPGLMRGDTLAATVPQPSDPNAVITYSVNNPPQDTPYVLKVRAKRTATVEGIEETKTSPFAPEVRTRTSTASTAA
ncbi:hypothetical protein VR44_06560 [Streptomyces katrae]|uniref:Uncharacterized protein n=2 Tax=Streptomyces katrae TaxID=68223 RepID=A0A0F4JRW1_9ACTN|nr:hypothetical protein VR44_06560 [Streptomyces katrae]